jgi:uncharacterized cupin superfamily protein
MSRPPYVIHAADVPETQHQYPRSEERMAPSRAVGHAAGLLRIGVHVVRVAPGTRTSYPHAEENEEEFVYVVDGELDAWLDGELHHVRAGDFIAFPAGTGICHTFINDGDRDALLLSGGERGKSDSRIFYPLNPERRSDIPWSSWWHDVPVGPQGGHPGKPRSRP